MANTESGAKETLHETRYTIDTGKRGATGTVLRAPFPWFGGKSRVAPQVWAAFGDVRNYVEPFFGSGAVLLGRPQPFDGIETVNDLDGFVSNAWRAIQHAPDATARWADEPVNENDLHARHVWLRERRETLSRRLEADPEYYDTRIAGWWLWGMACWIGGGFCGESGSGPWCVVDGQLVHLGDAGQGVARRRVHLGAGQGTVARKRVHLGNAGRGVAKDEPLVAWFRALQARLRRVRVCCGDWTRICGPTPTVKQGLTGVFLDPPYADTAGRNADLYATDSLAVAHAVREWAIAHGDDPMLRIVLCGYDGEHVMPASWRAVPWKADGGYGSRSNGRGRANAHREVLWLSPHCLSLDRPPIFALVEGGTDDDAQIDL